MTASDDKPWDVALIAAVLAEFDTRSAERIEPLGGTTGPRYLATGPWGHLVVRVRPNEFAEERLVRFDHEFLGRLARAGIPVPRPQNASDGKTWVRADGRTVEVLSWIDGGPASPKDLKAMENVGRFLAGFHAALGRSFPQGKEEFLREDHPDLVSQYVEQLQILAGDAERWSQISNAIGITLLEISSCVVR